MATPTIDMDRLAMFDLVRTKDPGDISGKTQVTERSVKSSRVFTYQLQDRTLWGTRFDRPIFTLATRCSGSILASYADNSFAMDVSVDGDDGELYCFTSILSGHATLHRPMVGHGCGLAWRPGPGTTLSVSDSNARTNVFLKVSEMEGALEHLLDEHLRQPLNFEPTLDWNTGPAASLKRHLDFVIEEFQRADGIFANAVGLASLTDLLISLALRGAPHNHSGRLAITATSAVPAYIRRAEEFMRAHGTEPIRMGQVAAAAGCSRRTLEAVFNRFRDQTPLAALHRIRLDLVRDELANRSTEAVVSEVARRHGFTNLARFATAYRRRFGEAPKETARHTLKGRWRPG
ncbi:helix-turn-helix transcriptional regulator [Bosea sp. BIWAKO-01]|uniref:AraC family transcriptional regulator n=1 Tax=Bosea sp. BIWAKO-01 TaxID=506668 RepID=UPI000A89B02D|nr:helix-turn-helix transcriptional regulator [Bosea sp. BIWAKO-01]